METKTLLGREYMRDYGNDPGKTSESVTLYGGYLYKFDPKDGRWWIMNAPLEVLDTRTAGMSFYQPIGTDNPDL